MKALSGLLTIARWEIKRLLGTMGTSVLPAAVVLLILLVVVTGFTATSGLHLQDGIYRIGVDYPPAADIVSADSRFTVYLADADTLYNSRGYFDVLIFGDQVYAQDTDRGLLQQGYADLARGNADVTCIFNKARSQAPRWISGAA